MSATFLRIPVDPILLFLWEQEQRHAARRAPWAWWWRYEDIPAITEAMPEGTSEEDARAVMKYLLDKDLVMGCICGCRGDFELSIAGRDRVYELLEEA